MVAWCDGVHLQKPSEGKYVKNVILEQRGAGSQRMSEKVFSRTDEGGKSSQERQVIEFCWKSPHLLGHTQAFKKDVKV
jgi:hypothetical protein